MALGDPKEAYGREHVVRMVDDDCFVEHLPGVHKARELSYVFVCVSFVSVIA